MKESLLFPCSKQGRWEKGYVNRETNEFVIAPKYFSAQHFKDGLAAVKLEYNGKWGVINEEDRLIIPFKYDDIKYYSESLMAAKLNNNWGFIDCLDKIIIPFKYEFASWFSEGLAPVQLNGWYGYINKSDEVVIGFQYNWAAPFENGFGEVELQGNRFSVDKIGNKWF